MATITRTFGTTLNSTYAPVAGVNPIVETLHLRDMAFDADERLAIYLDTSQAVIDIGSFNIAKIPNLDGDESTIEEALALSKAESESNKIGLRILTRKNNVGNWTEIAEFILLNYGRKDYLDLRTKTGYPTRILEKTDAIAIQLVDYGEGLLWDTDTITVSFALSIEIEKKNSLETFEARLATLELALEDRITNVLPGMVLGRNTGTGVVQQIPQSQFATPAQITTAINNLVGSSPAALDTLRELATALGDDANFASTVTNNLATKAPISNPSFTGFTTLGDNAAIKIKRLTGGVTKDTQGSNVMQSHGLDGSKIIGIIATVEYSPGSWMTSDHTYYAGFQFTAYIAGGNIDVGLHSTNSGNILSKPFTVLIFYMP